MRTEERADALLAQTALMEVLRPYGAVIVGSRAMELMTWNDLDIYVDSAHLDAEAWQDLTCAAMHALQPCRVDGFTDPAAGRYFFGAETEISGERWNIDIWAKTAQQIAVAKAENAAMKARFDVDLPAKDAMMRIKRALIERGMYGFDKGEKHFHSPEIYAAVLDAGVRTVEEFLEKQ
jgi:hypothetical protein